MTPPLPQLSTMIPPSPPNSLKSSMLNKHTTYQSCCHHWSSMSPIPPLYLCKKSPLHHHSTSTLTPTPQPYIYQYHLAQLKLSSVWTRVVTCKTPHTPSPTASYPWYTNGQLPPTSTLKRLTNASTNSMELYSSRRPKSATSKLGGGTSTCPL